LAIPVLLTFSLYIPFVQDFIKHEAGKYVESSTGLIMKVDRLSLRFPVELHLENIFLGHTQTDTLLNVGTFEVNVGIKQLYNGSLAPVDLDLQDVNLHFTDDSSGMKMIARLSSLNLSIDSVNLKRQTVFADILNISNADVYFAEGTATTSVDTVSASGADWQLFLNRLEIKNTAYRMKTADIPLLFANVSSGKVDRLTLNLKEPTASIDSVVFALQSIDFALVQSADKPLSFADINMQISDLNYSPNIMKARLKRLQLRGEQSEIYDASADFMMRDSIINSDLYMNALLGTNDILPFVADMPKQLLNRKMSLTTDITYSNNSIELHTFKAEIPDYLTIDAKGNATDFTDIASLNGGIMLKAKVDNLDFLIDSLQGFNVPPATFIDLQAVMQRGTITPSLNIVQNNGYFQLSGKCDIRSEDYNLRLLSRGLDLGAFLPTDSLGKLTAQLIVDGNGISNPEKMNANVQLQIDTFDFLAHTYNDITLTASVAASELKANLVSNDSAALLNINLDVSAKNKNYKAKIGGELQKIDFQALNMSKEELQLSLGLDLEATVNEGKNYFLDASIDSVKLGDNSKHTNYGNLSVNFNSNKEFTDALINTGDFKLKFQSDTIIDDVVKGFSLASDEIQKGIADRTFNMDSLNKIMPDFTFNASGTNDNVLGNILREYGLEFANLNINVESYKKKDFVGNVKMSYPKYNDFSTDSIWLAFRQNHGDFSYSLSLFAPVIKDVEKDFAKVELLGEIRHNNFTADLQMDGDTVFHTKGAITIDTVNTLKSEMFLNRLPLSWANEFIPEQTIELFGDLTGKIGLNGELLNPDLGGELYFENASVKFDMLGTVFALDSVPIMIDNGKMLFNSFKITPPESKSMSVNGSVTILPFEVMRSDMNISAENFRLIGNQKNDNTLLYGKAYSDINLNVKGKFSNLALDGKIDVLNSSAINYVIPQTEDDVNDASSDLVAFVSFADTVAAAASQVNKNVATNEGGISVNTLINIAPNVGVTVNLSDDGSNYAQAKGGGELNFSMTQENEMSLTGRYILSGGDVRYSLPVIGIKTFAIKEGSYVEWTGNAENPDLNITAIETLRIKVDLAEQGSRIVAFNAIIRIQNNLKNLEIIFDLETPNDQYIQNQLSTYSAEERSREALNLMIYGTYTGPGSASVSNSATSSITNNALNSFLESELNQWSRKYLGNMGLTFGVDSYNQSVTGESRTDVSYQFSHQLFNERVNVKIGGRIASGGGDPATSGTEQTLVDDISLEYYLNKKRTWLLKAFRHTGYESVLEGEVTQTGGGIVFRKNFRKLMDMFRKNKD
jgi:hypothetical protein